MTRLPLGCVEYVAPEAIYSTHRPAAAVRMRYTTLGAALREEQRSSASAPPTRKQGSDCACRRPAANTTASDGHDPLDEVSDLHRDVARGKSFSQRNVAEARAIGLLGPPFDLAEHPLPGTSLDAQFA